MKQLIFNGTTVGSIWKTDKPETKTPANAKSKPQINAKFNMKHDDGKKAAPFIPDSYSDPTASAALRNIMREEKRRKPRTVTKEV